MSATIHHLPLPPIRAIEPPTHRARYHAEALMRALVRDKRNDRGELALIADLIDGMLERMEGDRG